MRYRRAFVPGGSFFFTVVTDKRRPLLASQEAVEVLRNAFRVVRDKHHFDVDAIVVLPDHLHCIWTLPRDEADFTRHAEYIHYNPVKHGYATSPIEWPYSSFRRYVEAGTYPSDWGRGMIEFEGVGRE